MSEQQVVAVARSLRPSTSWQIPHMADVICPVCGFDYGHIVKVYTVEGKDDYAAGWGGRGNLTVLRIGGECDHMWEVCFGEHKGNVACFCRLLPDSYFDYIKNFHACNV